MYNIILYIKNNNVVDKNHVYEIYADTKKNIQGWQKHDQYETQKNTK